MLNLDATTTAVSAVEYLSISEPHIVVAETARKGQLWKAATPSIPRR